MKSVSSTRLIVLLMVWLLAAGSCFIWGLQRQWIAGLCVTVISLAMLYYARFEEENASVKRRYAMAGLFFLALGLVLLYTGIIPPLQK